PVPAPGRWWAYTNAWSVAQARIPELLCPTAPPEKPTVGVFIRYFVYESGGSIYYTASYFGADTAAIALEPSHYFGVAGYWAKTGFPSFDRYLGIFYNRSRTASRSISDGLSKTLMFGES